MRVLILVGLLALLLGGFVVFVSRPHTVVRIGRGDAELVRGALPPGLLGALADVARADQDAAGTVELRGHGDTLRLDVRGLGEGLGQRVRNVVMLRNSQIRRR